MLFLRGVMVLCLLAGLVCFGIFLLTGRAQWRTRALRLVFGTLGVVLAFAAVLWLQTL